jgi:hypothetical protein
MLSEAMHLLFGTRRRNLKKRIALNPSQKQASERHW